MAWERAVSRRPGGQPLVDLSLFRSAGFTWGTALSTMVQFALFGITFAMPQFFLEVRGLDSLASGVRMLPLIGGLALGLGVGQRLQTPRKSPDGEPSRGPVAGAKTLVSAGFAIMAVALAVGAGTHASSGTGFVSAWFAAVGVGLGIALPTAMNAALGALTAERSGSGSALMTALRQVGAAIGRGRARHRAELGLPGPPEPDRAARAAASAAHASVAGGLQVAHQLGSLSLLAQVRAAYASGLDVMLWVCAAIALAAALLALLFLPRQAALADAAGPAAGGPGGRRRERAGGRHTRGCRGRMTPMNDDAPAGRPAGLRERKKARTRAAIREHALRLFREQGYARDHRGADRRGGRRLARDVLPLLPDQGRRRAPGRPGHPRPWRR